MNLLESVSIFTTALTYYLATYYVVNPNSTGISDALSIIILIFNALAMLLMTIMLFKEVCQCMGPFIFYLTLFLAFSISLDLEGWKFFS